MAKLKKTAHESAVFFCKNYSCDSAFLQIRAAMVLKMRLCQTNDEGTSNGTQARGHTHVARPRSRPGEWLRLGGVRIDDAHEQAGRLWIAPSTIAQYARLD